MSRHRTLEQARERLDEQLASKPDDPRLLQMRAKAAERLGAHEEAATFWQRAARSLRAADDRAGEAAAWLETATAFARSGHRAKARNFFQRAVAGAELVGDAAALARARMVHARHLIELREDPEARPLLERVLEPLTDARSWEEFAWASGELARILSADGDTTVALTHARAAVEASAKAKNTEAFGERLGVLAGLHLKAGHLAKARSYQEKALNYLKGAGQRGALLGAYRILVDVSILQEDFGAAERFLVEAIMVADGSKDGTAQGWLRFELARIVARRDRSRSRTLLEQAVDRFHRSGEPRGAAAAYGELGDVAVEQEPEVAARAFRRSADFYEMVGDSDKALEMSTKAAAAERPA